MLFVHSKNVEMVRLWTCILLFGLIGFNWLTVDFLSYIYIYVCVISFMYTFIYDLAIAFTDLHR